MHITIKNYPNKDGKIGGKNIKRVKYFGDPDEDEIEKNWKASLPKDWKPFWEREENKEK